MLSRVDAYIDRRSRALEWLAIAPVPLDLSGKDKDQVGFGSYLVNAVGGCNDCHTNPSHKPGSDPFFGQTKGVNVAGYLAGGVAFGPFTSRNITPSVNGPVTGSLANFKLTLRTGVDLRKLHPQISPLLQVMPWPVHQDMTDADLETALEPFRQIATSRQTTGTGLGLPLTKALVEANRASFSIKSRKKEGTLVEVTFPPTRVLAE